MPRPTHRSTVCRTKCCRRARRAWRRCWRATARDYRDQDTRTHWRSFATRSAMRSRYGSSDLANPGTARVAHGELQLGFRRHRWTAQLCTVVGVAPHPQPLERHAPVRIGIEQPGRGPGVPTLVATIHVAVDFKPVIARAQRLPAEAL